MAEGKTSVKIYTDWIETFQELSDEDAGRLIKHFFQYVNDMKPKEPNGLLKIAWIPIRQVLKRDLDKWRETCEINRENGKKGGRPKKTETTERLFKKPKKADKDIDKDIDKDSIYPTLSEVELFFFENGFTKQSGFNAWHYYSENNWKDKNGKKVSNWKNKMRNNWFKDENRRELKPEEMTTAQRFEYLEGLGNRRTEKQEIEYWDIKTGHAS